MAQKPYSGLQILTFNQVRDTLPVLANKVISHYKNGNISEAYSCLKQIEMLKASAGGREYAAACDLMQNGAFSTEDQKAWARSNSFEAYTSAFKDAGFDTAKLNVRLNPDTLRARFTGLSDTNVAMLSSAHDPESDAKSRLFARRAGDFLYANCDIASESNPMGGAMADQILQGYQDNVYKSTDIIFGGSGKSYDDFTTADIEAVTSLASLMAGNKLGETNARRFYNASLVDGPEADNTIGSRVNRIKNFEKFENSFDPTEQYMVAAIAESDAGLKQLLSVSNSNASQLEFRSKIKNATDNVMSWLGAMKNFSKKNDVDVINYYLQKEGLPSTFDGDANAETFEALKQAETDVINAADAGYIFSGRSKFESVSPFAGKDTLFAESTKVDPTTGEAANRAPSRGEAIAQDKREEQFIERNSESLGNVVNGMASSAIAAGVSADECEKAFQKCLDHSGLKRRRAKVFAELVTKFLPNDPLYSFENEEQSEAAVNSDIDAIEVLDDVDFEADDLQEQLAEKMRGMKSRDLRKIASSPLFSSIANKDLLNRLISGRDMNVVIPEDEALRIMQAANNALDPFKSTIISSAYEARRNYGRRNNDKHNNYQNLVDELNSAENTFLLGGTKITTYDLLRLAGNDNLFASETSFLTEKQRLRELGMRRYAFDEVQEDIGDWFFDHNRDRRGGYARAIKGITGYDPAGASALNPTDNSLLGNATVAAAGNAALYGAGAGIKGYGYATGANVIKTAGSAVMRAGANVAKHGAKLAQKAAPWAILADAASLAASEQIVNPQLEFLGAGQEGLDQSISGGLKKLAAVGALQMNPNGDLVLDKDWKTKFCNWNGAVVTDNEDLIRDASNEFASRLQGLMDNDRSGKYVNKLLELSASNKQLKALTKDIQYNSALPQIARAFRDGGDILASYSVARENLRKRLNSGNLSAEEMKATYRSLQTLDNAINSLAND